jgi:cell division protein FtsN
LVGGCFKVKENADNLAKKLVTQGYPAEVSRHGREFYKVTVQSFETRSEAEEGLSKILDSDPDTDYWLKIDK